MADPTPGPTPPPPATAPLTDAEIQQLRDVLALLNNGYCLVPCATEANQMLVSFDMNGTFEWGILPPAFEVGDQPLKFGQGIPAPYWANVMVAAPDEGN